MEGPHPIFRWTFAIGCFGLALWFLKNAFPPIEGEFRPFDTSGLVIGGLLLALGFFAIVTNVIQIATKPFVLLIDSIFFPGGKLSKPILNLKLPEFYLREGRYEEALDEYQKIMRHYPDETAAYEGAIDLLVNEFSDLNEAGKIHRKSQRRHLILLERVNRYFEKGRLR